MGTGYLYHATPFFTISAAGSTWPFNAEYGNADLTAPIMTISFDGLAGEVGGLAQDDGYLPYFEMEAEGLTELIGTFDESMPFFEISAILLAGMVVSGEIDLPPPELAAEGLTGEVGELDAETPTFGIFADITVLQIPSLELTAEGLTGEVGTLALNIPFFTESATGLGNEVGTLEANIPFPRISAELAVGHLGNADLTFPKFQISASQAVSYDQIGTVDVNLPRFTMSASGFGPEAVKTITAELTFPFFQIEADGLYGHNLSTELTAPSMTLSATGLAGEIGTLDQEIPSITVSAEGYVTGAQGAVALELPAFELEAYGVGDEEREPLSISDVFVMNTNNFAVTEYTNFGFNSYCLFNGVYLGANANGIYRLDQDDDAGAAISLDIQKTKIDFGTIMTKRATDAYLTITADSDYKFTMTADDLSRTYRRRNGHEGTRNDKFDLGKGMKGRWIGWQLQNINGSDITLDQVNLLIEITGRRIHNVRR